MDLLAVGHQCVACQRVVVFEAGELANAANLAVDRAQTRAVALASLVDYLNQVAGTDIDFPVVRTRKTPGSGEACPRSLKENNT